MDKVFETIFIYNIKEIERRFFMEKPIKDYEDYHITDDGKVISYKYSKPRIMKTWYQASGYENIKLCKNNQTKHFLIHRLVAEAFIPNPNNLPEVNHKNKNRQDNRVENLEWCDRITNLYDSYSTMSPVRNHIVCELYSPKGNKIGEFESIQAAARYSSEHFGTSISGMVRNHQSKNYKVVKKV